MRYLGNDSSGSPVYQMQRGVGNAIFTNDVIILSKKKDVWLVYHQGGFFLDAVNLDGNKNPVLSRIYQGSELRWSNDNQQDNGAGLVVSVGINEHATTIAVDPKDIPKLEGLPIPEESKGWTTITPIPEQDKNAGILGTPIAEQDKDAGIMAGPEIGAEDWWDGILTADNRLPVTEPTKASNGLTIESNPKHTPGAQGFNSRAGVEPRNSKELFENSVSIPNDEGRYTRDSDGNIHRFFESSPGVYHWTGSTGDKRNTLKLENDVKAKLRKQEGWKLK